MATECDGSCGPGCPNCDIERAASVKEKPMPEPEKVEGMVFELREKFGFAERRVEAAPEWGQMGLFA